MLPGLLKPRSVLLPLLAAEATAMDCVLLSEAKAAWLEVMLASTFP